MKKIIFIAFILVSVIAIFFLKAMYFMSLNDASMQKMTIGGQEIEVRVADSAEERYQGLSGVREEELQDGGMLFVFSDSEPRTFVMRGMLFPLDFVWIRDGVVVKVDEGAKPPKDGENPQEISSNPFFVDMVLELPAGTVSRLGIEIGGSAKLKK